MSPRQLLIVALVSLAVAVLSVFVIDVPLARLLDAAPPDLGRWSGVFTWAMEIPFGMTLSKFALGAALIAAGVVAYAVRRWRAASLPLLFIGLTHFTARLIAGVLKNVFGRLRPFEAESAGWHDAFFADGSAMPSGHAVHFWALFFPLAMLFPRARWILLPLPVLISAARVLVNDHYLSDVVASVAIAALVTWAYARTKLYSAFAVGR